MKKLRVRAIAPVAEQLAKERIAKALKVILKGEEMEIAIYARVSTNNQKKEATIESQLQILKQHVTNEGWNITSEHIYCDDGISGARLERPSLELLRDAAKRGEFDVVLVLSTDRLARNYAHQWLIMDELEKCGVKVIFLDNPYDDTPQGKLLTQMQGIIAEYERTAILERTRRGRLEKARQGELMAWAYNCYGYNYLAKRAGFAPQVVINETQAEVIRTIYHWLVADQLSLREITRRLIERGIATPSGKRKLWFISSVAAILTNPSYMGKAHYNRRITTSGKRSLRPNSQWISSNCPAIISPELFAKAQEQLKRNRAEATKMYQTGSHRYLLRTRVKCGECGLAMIGMARSKQSHPYLYYKCSGKDKILHARENSCPSRFVNATELDELVWNALLELLDSPDMIKRLHQQWSNEKSQDDSQFAIQQRSLLERKNRLEKQIQRLIDAYQLDLISVTELKVRKDKLASDIDQISQAQQQLIDQQHQLIYWQSFIENVSKFRTLLGTNLSLLSFEDRQTVIQCLIERVVVSGQDIDIFYVFPFLDPPRLLPDTSSLLPAYTDTTHFCRLRLDHRGYLSYSNTLYFLIGE